MQSLFSLLLLLSVPQPEHVLAPSTNLAPHVEQLESGDVDQGYNGDCWLNAVMAALAYRQPQAIKAAIRDTQDPNIWQVRIFDLKTRRPRYYTVTRAALNDPLADKIVNDIKWPCILQNAVVQYNDDTHALNPNATGYRGLNVGFPDRAFSMLLGDYSTMTPIETFADDAALQTRVRSKSPLVLVTPADPGLGLVPWHAYTVLDVDQQRGGGITFRNPWGRGGFDGKGTNYLSAADIRAHFLGVYFSWPAPATSAIAPGHAKP